jgi:hypothetical protein
MRCCWVFTLFLVACSDKTPEVLSDAGAVLADSGPPRCGSAGNEFSEGLTELFWDDDTVGSAPYAARDLSMMQQPYNGSAEVAGQHEHWEAVRFELEHPATIHAIRVRATALGNLREDDEWQLGLYGDFGNNGFDFDRWDPLWEGSRCGEAIERDAWVTFALDEPIEVAEPGLIFVANHRQNLRSPGWVFSENRSDDCSTWDDCHSAWNFPDLDANTYNGPSFPLPFNYAVRLVVELHDRRPERASFTPLEDLNLSNRSAWADYDGDGYADVLVNGLKLYRNLANGTFEDVTEAAGLAGVSGSGIWGDLDNDGCLDLVVFGDRERIFSGDCNAAFVERTDATGIDDRQNVISCRGEPNEHASTMAVALFDYNGDGWLDVYLANGECWRDNRGSYYADKVYKGLGDWRFEDVSGQLGFASIGTYSRAIAPADYNRDGLTDLLVGNYRLQRNFLFESLGESVRETGLRAGVAGDMANGAYGHGIGAVWSDINGDEYLDLVIANLAHPRFYHFSDRTKVLLGSESGRFEDVSEAAGIRYQETHSVPAMADFNQDGYVDLAITAVYPGRPTDLYFGGSDGRFENAIYGSGITTTGGWGAAVADVDNDGDADLALDRLYLNDSADAGAWMQVRAVGNLGAGGVNRSALGAQVRLEGGGRSFLRQVSGCNGQGGQDDLALHFGLGQVETLDRVSVLFPGLDEPVVIEGPIDASQRLWVFADGSHGFGWTQP